MGLLQRKRLGLMWGSSEGAELKNGPEKTEERGERVKKGKARVAHQAETVRLG